MSEENWKQDYAKTLGIYLSGKGIPTPGPKGEKILDDNFFIIFNAYHDALTFKLPPARFGRKWTKILDTSINYFEETGETFKALETVHVEGRSVLLLKEPT
jgi:isoamylase